MSCNGKGYDTSSSQFSPEGRLIQVEYAQNASDNSGTVIGLRGKDGVVFAVEKLATSELLEPKANKRTLNIDNHAGLAISGLISDSRPIIETARAEAMNYRTEYGCSIPLSNLNDRLAMYMHAYTLYSAARPFGCTVILGGNDADGPHMYMIDPSGVSCGYYGCAAGKAKQAANAEIEKLKLEEMCCRDLVKEATRIIYLVHDELVDNHFELELSWIGVDSKGLFEQVPKEVFLEAEEYAKAAKKAYSDS